VSTVAWFGLGFLIGSLLMAIAMFFRYRSIVDYNLWLINEIVRIEDAANLRRLDTD
jgi:hypothetical protein